MFDWVKRKFWSIKYKCPKCGSTNVSYIPRLANFIEVIREQEPPRYVDTIKCSDCSYEIKSLHTCLDEINKSK